jgi:ribose transport system ATP-binding protein
MEIYPGEVVGLVGENGAGKSTLLKIMMGIEQATEGTMKMHGRDYAPRTPIEANAHGVGMVFQEQSLIRNLTVGQNIFFGREENYTRFGVLNKKKMFQDASKALEDVEIGHIQPEKKVLYSNSARIIRGMLHM